MALPVSGTDNRPTEIERKPVPMGDNPYFPADDSPQPQETEVPEGETQVAADEAIPSTEEPEGEQRTDQEPTFDIETDRNNGIDVDDPNYKHYQAAFTRARQRDKDEVHTRIEQLEQQAQLKKVESETAPSVNEQPEFISINWTEFDTPNAGAESALSGVEDEVSQLVQKHIDYAVRNIGTQQQVAIQQYQAQQAQSAITEFVGQLPPSKTSEAIQLLEEYREFAKATPDKWIKFARNILVPEPVKTETPTSPDPRRLVDKQRASTPPPSNSATTTAKKPTFTSTADAVAWAMDQQ